MTLDTLVPETAFTRLVTVDFYDGPTAGVVESAGSAYAFRMAAWDGRQARRIYVVRPITREVFERVREIAERAMDVNETDEQRDAFWERMLALMDQAGSVESLVIAHDRGAPMRVRPVRDDAERERIEAMLLPRPDPAVDEFAWSAEPHERWLAFFPSTDDRPSG